MSYIYQGVMTRRKWRTAFKGIALSLKGIRSPDWFSISIRMSQNVSSPRAHSTRSGIDTRYHNRLARVWTISDISPLWCLWAGALWDRNKLERSRTRSNCVATTGYAAAHGSPSKRVRIVQLPNFRTASVLWALPIVSWMRRSYCLGKDLERALLNSVT